MTLVPYIGDEPPRESMGATLRPRLVAWTARVWQRQPGSYMPLVKLDAALEPGDIADTALADVLAPFERALASMQIYLVHSDESRLDLPWASGALSIQSDRSFVFLYDFLATPMGAVMAPLLQAPGATCDLAMRVVPYALGGDRLVFAIMDYDFGISNRIG